MAKKEFTYKGKTIEELKGMSISEFAELLPSRERRTLKRGFTEQQKLFLENFRKNKGKTLKTHCRDLVILPEMVGSTLLVHRGNSFAAVRIEQDMLGHRIGEFVLTRKRVAHSAPGIGATRSSASISVK